MAKFLESLNLIKTCREYRVKLWQCPQFLFIIMGGIVILTIIGTNIVASRYADPEISALIVLIVAAILFVIGNIIVKSFEAVAKMSRAKSEFINIISHQLRNPLSSIKWHINLLMSRRISLNDGEINSSLNTIEDENKRMLGLVNSLLEVSRIEDNKILLRPFPFSIYNLTKKSIDDFQFFIQNSGVKVNLTAPKDLAEVYADESKIKIVIDNLLDNAIRYSSRGGEISIKIEQAEKPSFIKWSIKDQGVGIPAKDIKRIFEKFFRAHNAFQYQTEGNGIGLFISRSIIEASEGKIYFLSKENSGSIFWFTLPVKK